MLQQILDNKGPMAGCRVAPLSQEQHHYRRPRLFAAAELAGSGDQVVGEAGLGTEDEGADLVRFQDERGGVRVGGPAQGDAPAG